MTKFYYVLVSFYCPLLYSIKLYFKMLVLTSASGRTLRGCGPQRGGSATRIEEVWHAIASSRGDFRGDRASPQIHQSKNKVAQIAIDNLRSCR